MISAGIDIGSTATKAIVFDWPASEARPWKPTGWDPKEAGLKALRSAD